MELLRYPMKSARGERIRSMTVVSDGVAGDRVWACVDAADGTVGSAKHPRRWGSLLRVDARTIAGAVHLTVGERRAVAGTDAADAVLTSHLGRPVRLTRVRPDVVRVHRLMPDDGGMRPEWMSAAPGAEIVTEESAARPGGRFVDFGAVHVVTTGALDDLATRLGRPKVPVARFRPNLVIQALKDPEAGVEFEVGDAAFRVVLPTPRCIVPGLSDDADDDRDDDAGDATDRALLGTLARDYRREVAGFGRAACFGFYCEVLRPGTVAVGQRARQVR